MKVKKTIEDLNDGAGLVPESRGRGLKNVYFKISREIIELALKIGMNRLSSSVAIVPRFLNSTGCFSIFRKIILGKVLNEYLPDKIIFPWDPLHSDKISKDLDLTGSSFPHPSLLKEIYDPFGFIVRKFEYSKFIPAIWGGVGTRDPSPISLFELSFLLKKQRFYSGIVTGIYFERNRLRCEYDS